MGKTLRLGIQDDGALRRGDMRGIDAGRKMGARTVRIIIDRSKVQQEGWGEYDRMIHSARVRGLRPQVVLDTGTTWAQDLGGFSRFAKDAAKHLNGKVSRYSIENEPDIRLGNNPELYRQLYAVGRKAVKSANKSNQVMFGEFSPHGAVGYAKKVLKKKGVVADGYAFHPYQFTTDPLAPGEYPGSIGRLGAISRSISRMNIKTPGGHTPGMYLTEFGYFNKGQRMTDPQTAAVWWPRAIRKARNAGAKQLIAYTMTAGPQEGWDTSLLNPDGSPRPAYNAIRRTMRR